MKKFIVMAVLSLMLAVTVNAQDNSMKNASHKSGKLTKKQRHKLVKDLHLTKAQKSTWKASKAEFKVKQQAIKNNAALTEIEKKEQLRSLHKERMENLKTLLTPEQLKIFQNDMQQNR